MVRFSKLILILSISFCLSFKTEAKNPPPGTGTSDIPANILIMLDNSGSMSAKLYNSVEVYYPSDVSTDSAGNIYVMEFLHNRIKVFDSSGNYKRSIGSYGWGCNQWRYSYQFEIHNDKIYLTDFYNQRLKVLDLNGRCLSNVYVNGTQPTGIAVSNNYTFVRFRGYYSQRTWIQKFRTSDLRNLGIQTLSSSYMTYGTAMNFNNSGTKLLINHDQSNNNFFSEFNVASNGYLSFSRIHNKSYSGSDGYFRIPFSSDYDSSGNIYVSDTINHRIQKLSSSFVYQSKIGSYSQSSPFRNPWGIHIDKNDNIYVADYYNFAIRKFNTSLTLTQTYGGAAGTRLDAAKKVIKKIVSNTDLTSGANFGLMEWGTRHNIRVKISDNGAKQIYSNVDGVYASGGTDLRTAMNNARNYFTSGQVANWNLTCSLNYLIVISDGYWSGHSSVISIANQIRSAYNIKTFAVGFALGGANSNYSSLATAGGTSKPLYASNETELLQKLTDAIKQAISGRLTFTTPAVMSDVTKGNFIYQSTFEYTKDAQWKGSLKKYKLNTNGSFGAVQWDAADKLNSKNASSRNLWTPEIDTNLNNFTTSNRDTLKSKLFPSQSPTNTEVENLINFIRGVDTYDQDADGNKTESIHKLADIYHSDLIVVGKPEAPAINDGSINSLKKDSYYRLQNNYNNFINGATCGGPCQNRKEVVYAGANNGILHAFDATDGNELWGYIPPNILGNLEKIPSSKANSTNAIYGIDGSPVVKDIFFDDTPNDGSNNPRWRTILIGGLGAGGKGIYTLDITNPNSPKHLFAINNDETIQAIQHWDSSRMKNEFGYASGSIDSKYDYRQLGETWSTPKIIRIKVSGKDKWVAVFGAGYNGAANPNIGSAVFVMDLEDEGRLLSVIDIKSQNARIINTWRAYIGSSHPYLSNNNSDLDITRLFPNLNFDVSKGESVKAETNSDVKTTLTFSGSGNVKTVSKASFNTRWRPGYITITKMKVDIANSIPADLSVITADGTSKANYDGAMIYASDLEGKITKINLTENFNIDNDVNSPTYNLLIRNNSSNKKIQSTTLFNSETTSANGRYIYTRPEVTINNDNNLWLYFGTGNTQKLQEQSNQIQNRLYGIKDVNFPNFVEVNTPGTVSQCRSSPTCPTGNDLGWYVNLEKSQKLTAEPTVDKDRVYFPIYEPSPANNKCGVGTAILRAYDLKCGNSLLNVNLGTGVLSKVVKQGDNLYIGLAGEADKNISGFTSTDNLITGKSQAKDIGGEAQLEKWKENY